MIQRVLLRGGPYGDGRHHPAIFPGHVPPTLFIGDVRRMAFVHTGEWTEDGTRIYDYECDVDSSGKPKKHEAPATTT